MNPMKVYKWLNTLFLHTHIGKGKSDEEEFDIGMSVNGMAIYVSFKDDPAWWVVKTEDVIKYIIAYRNEHKNDPADDAKKEGE